MKGTKCRCGFATTSERMKCPRCGRLMKPAEWPDEGKILSFTPLQVIPEGMLDPRNLVLVEIDRRGPKVVCWTEGKLTEGQTVLVTGRAGSYSCEAKHELRKDSSKSDR